MRHDMMTLAEFGIEGAPEGDPEVVGLLQPDIVCESKTNSQVAYVHSFRQVCLIHYDFKPEQHDNPLLLATEQN